MSSRGDHPEQDRVAASAAARAAILPQDFREATRTAGAEVYLAEPLAGAQAEFFERKGLAALKDEDQREEWYEDWLAWQAERQLYARLLSPRAYSRLGSEFELLRHARFLEMSGFYSAAHGYSLQVSALGLWAIQLGANEALKREAVAALEAGSLLAFGISEQRHGSDLLGNEFSLRESEHGRYLADGAKYYIGNANCAAMIATLARKEDRRSARRDRRAPVALLALRPAQVAGWSARKIRTLGVRAGFVGEFAVKSHEVRESDLIAEGRQAWDAVFGAVTLGKLFLGFGSIGICEHAFAEAAEHLRGRLLYGRRAIDMPHLRATMVQAYSRLSAMKLYAYRALDYVQAASAEDRRYLLYAAVQKARLSTEGVKVLALLSECIGARGFEAETYFEMALRDVQLIPGLEGSTHINLGQTAQFAPRYFGDGDTGLAQPGSLVAAAGPAGECAYLLEARSGGVNTIAFGPCLAAYGALKSVENVRLFAGQVEAFQQFARRREMDRTIRADTPEALAIGRCLATIVYGQLVAEHAALLGVSASLLATMFQAFVNDFNGAVLDLASCGGPGELPPELLQRLIAVPCVTDAALETVAQWMDEAGAARGRTA